MNDRLKALLRSYDPAPRPGAKERIARRLREEVERPARARVPWLLPALAATAAAAAVAVYLGWPGPGIEPAGVRLDAGSVEIAEAAPEPTGAGRALPLGVDVVVKEPVTVSLPLARLHAPRGTRLRVVEPDPRSARIELREGVVHSEVHKLSAGERYEVQTPHAVARVLGTVFEVRSNSEGTTVVTTRGVVEVRGETLDGPVRVPAGRTLHVPSVASIQAQAARDLARADAARRAGRLEAAAKAYGEIAVRPHVGALAEEALVQRALVELERNRPSAALQALDEADRRFPHGMLSPERAALAARALIRQGDLDGAHRRLEGVSGSVSVTAARVELAEAYLAAGRRAQARALVRRLSAGALPEPLAERVERLRRALP